ncbi:MAG TPA: glutathione binding-like protein, partial [Polyangia bacterium]
GHPMSTCTRKVLTTLAENQTEAQFEMVDLFKGAHKAPAYLAHQPFGQVPALEDDGFQIYESRAICRYIDGKSKGAVTPGDAKSRAVMEQWISIETSNFTPSVMKFIYHHIFNNAQSQETLDAATAQLEKVLDVMDKQLASQPFLAGSAFSLADICFMPYIEYAMKTPAATLFTSRPHVAKWWSTVSARPSWQKAIGANN